MISNFYAKFAWSQVELWWGRRLDPRFIWTKSAKVSGGEDCGAWNGAIGVSGGCDGAQNEMKTPLKSFLALLLGHRSPKEKEEENFRGVGGEAMFATDRFSSASLRGFWTKPSFPT